MADDKQETAALKDAGIATPRENARLKHSNEKRFGEKGTVTTRDDLTDVGVPMLQGSPEEPIGPEDAFGPGPKRGDYSERTGGVTSFESVAVPGADLDDPFVRDGDGNIVDNKPRVAVLAQTPRASEQGEVAGRKGGVDTADRD